MILALDPGTEQTGWCVYDPESKRVVKSGISPNHDVLLAVQNDSAYQLAIELIEGMGMTVGKTTFTSVRWIGRFQQAWRSPETVQFVTRREVKLFLCGSMRAKDKNIRQAIIDTLGPVGTKKNPGPCYGVSSHIWSAVGVALTAQGETK